MDHLSWLAREKTGPEWLEALPRLVSEAVQRWDLTLGEPYTRAQVSYVVPAGPDVVLKVPWPHPECRYEAEAVALWDGDGAVRLVAHDPASGAMLLERCVPGTPLSTVEPLVGLLPRLWKPAGAPFISLRDEALDWAARLVPRWEKAGRPFERRLVDAALDLLPALASSQGEQVLLHQDLHGDNVLAAQREPWLVIDPKPLAGEREFGLASIVRAPEFGYSREQMWYRLDMLTAELGLDRERALGWTIGQTVAWAFEDDGWVSDTHPETVRWLLDGR